MLRLFFLFSIFVCTVLPSQARTDYRAMMLAGDFDQATKEFNEEKDLKKLFSDEAILYMHTLVMDGKINESLEYAQHYMLRFPKEEDFEDFERNAYLFMGNLGIESLTKNQKAHIKYMKTIFPSIKNDKEKYLKEILKLEQEFYLPSKYDYAFSLSEKSFDQKIKKDALDTIVSKQSILFPKTKDVFELAYAYKALAVIKIHEEDLAAAKRFIKIAQDYIFKMRSIWLVEDLSIYNKILKTTKVSTRFASLYPQYLMKLRDEFSSFLI